jgi:hypothetical protein
LNLAFLLDKQQRQKGLKALEELRDSSCQRKGVSSMDKRVMALGPAFAAGFAVQPLLEIFDPILDKIKVDKKILLDILSLIAGFVLTFGAGVRVL